MNIQFLESLGQFDFVRFRAFELDNCVHLDLKRFKFLSTVTKFLKGSATCGAPASMMVGDGRRRNSAPKKPGPNNVEIRFPKYNERKMKEEKKNLRAKWLFSTLHLLIGPKIQKVIAPIPQFEELGLGFIVNFGSIH